MERLYSFKIVDINNVVSIISAHTKYHAAQLALSAGISVSIVQPIKYYKNGISK